MLNGLRKSRRLSSDIRHGWRLYSRREDGSISIEFAFLGPIFMILMFGVLELALISLSVSGVKAGLNDVGRVIRVGQGQDLNDAEVTQIVCRAALISSCSDSVEIERQRFAAGAGADAVAVDEWSDLNADDIVLLTARYDWTVINPLLMPFIGDGGDFSIQGAVVFKSENF